MGIASLLWDDRYGHGRKFSDGARSMFMDRADAEEDRIREREQRRVKLRAVAEEGGLLRLRRVYDETNVTEGER